MERLLVLVVLKDFDQASERLLPRGLRHLSVGLLRDLPELVQVKILAGIDLVAGVFRRVFVFAAKEVL